MRWLTIVRQSLDRSDRAPVRRPLPRRTRMLRRIAMAVLVLGLMAGLAQTPWPVVLAGSVADSIALQLAKAGFRVERIYLQGRRNASVANIRKALQISAGSPIFAVSLEAARQRLEALPYVKYASVQRHFPNILVVSILERRPIALWTHDNDTVLVDEDGEVIRAPLPSDAGRFLLLTGADAPRHGAALLDMLSREPELKKLVTSAERIGGRRWNLRLGNDVTVALPEKDPLSAWRKLAGFQRDHKLLDRLLSIDMRQSDKFPVRIVPGNIPEISKPKPPKARAT